MKVVECIYIALMVPKTKQCKTLKSIEPFETIYTKRVGQNRKENQKGSIAV